MRLHLKRNCAGLKTIVAVCFGLVVLTLAAIAQTSSEKSGGELQKLEKEIVRLAEASGGKVGVAAVHLETGRSVQSNGMESFPMASTFKVPIAVQYFTLLDQKKVSLETMVTLTPADIHPGSGEISHLLGKPGVSLSHLNLLELMLLISDNSATDQMVKAAGGPAAVTQRMKELGIEGVRVDRPTINLIADWLGMKLPPESDWNTKMFGELYKQTTKESRDAAEKAFDSDPRDTATPAGMTRLLEKIWRGQALSESSTKQLLDIMRRCETGKNRIRGMLPPNTDVMDKTGTIGGTTNDVGIITLPDNAGHIAISIFVRESKKDVADREKVIAQIARAVYDYFLFRSEKE
ncbi:MAG: class A beta-lactamase [Acidobacteria bacterium]|nr:class A beta-lactamase [Acidobacteriota bacterium]